MRLPGLEIFIHGQEIAAREGNFIEILDELHFGVNEYFTQMLIP